MSKKDVYSLRDDGYDFVQIRRNDKTSIDIVAVFTYDGCGQFTTKQSRKQSKRLANKIVKILNQ